MTPESVQVSDFQRETHARRRTTERKEWIHDYDSGYCSSKTHWSRFMKSLEEAIAAALPRCPLLHSSRRLGLPTHAHPAAPPVGSSPAVVRKQILCLESVASAARPALRLHLTSTHPCWSAPTSQCCFSREATGSSRHSYYWNVLKKAST